jgi:arylsulfatase A-like enzyme
MSSDTLAVRNNDSGLFGYLCLFTLFFVLIEISFAIQGDKVYLGDFSYISDHLSIPPVILAGVFFFLFAQALVHLGFTTGVWAVVRLVGAGCKLSWQQTQKLGFMLWFGSLVTVLLANQHYFPNSKFADLTQLILPGKMATGLFYLSGSALLVIVMLAVFFLLLRMAQRNKSILVLTLITGVCLLKMTPAPHMSVSGATQTQPNIILIGVDSLRPDFLHQGLTPRLDSFLNAASIADFTLTPIARTFPAWVSLLSGRYPKLTGMRFDLGLQTQLDGRQMLPEILRQHGYHTLYAIDETRFSNIGKNFGFDEIVTPPMGLNDFLLGTFNDFPLSNLLVNTGLGKWLFPYSYANRPAFITYQPNSFLKLLKGHLATAQSKPLFLAVHFCLPHSPYFWSAYSPAHSTEVLAHYRAAIQRADRQVNDFLTLLTQMGLMEHSIVVLMSDHGEALELDGDRVTAAAKFIPGQGGSATVIPRFYPASFDTEAVNQSAGHGTDVMSLSQYHAVMAFRFYGAGRHGRGTIPGLTSLLDIKPTLLAFLKIAPAGDSGNSLLAYIDGKQLALTPTDFFTESDFSPQAMRTVHPELKKVLEQGLDFFQVDPVTTQLTVKAEMGPIIIASKQYADIYGDWMLALYPQHAGIDEPILINLKTGWWTNDLRTGFAKQSPASHMLYALRKFYGQDIGLVMNS